MAINIKNNVLNTWVTGQRGRGLTIDVTIYPKDENEWKGGTVTVTFHDPDHSIVYDKKLTLTVPDSGKETVKGTLNEWYYGDPLITFDGDVTKFVGKPQYLLNLVNNIPNTTVTQEDKGEREPTGVQVYAYLYLHITCKNGFKMLRDTIQFNGKEIPNPTWSADDTVLVSRIYINTNDRERTRTLTGETVSTGKPETTVTNNITGNCEEMHTVDGTNVSITVTGNSDYAKFVGVSVEYTDINGETKTFVPDYSGNVINISLTDVKEGTTVTLSGAYRLVCTTVNSMTGCNVTGLKPYYIENETVNVIATAKGKTHFDAANLPVANWEMLVGGTQESTFVLSDNGKTATLNFKFPNDKEKVSDSTFTLLGGTIPDTEVTGYGSINVYLVDTKTLEDFSKIRFTKKLNENYEHEYYDIGKYVNRLHKVYVDVPNISPTSLKLANFDTSINTNSVDDSKVHVDFGNVLLPVNSDSGNDFNATIQCFIPFVGFLPVDSDFIGKELNLSYDIDLITGYCAYNLSCNSITINNGATNCSSEIIYKTSANDEISTIGDLSDLNTVLMGLEPYITIKYFEPLSVPVNNTTEQKRVGDVTGFAQFENVNLSTTNSMLVDEFNEIVSQLENGVYL